MLQAWIRASFFRLCTDGRFFHVFCRGEHRLRAPSQAVDFLRFRWPSLILIKGFIDTTQYGFQRNPCFFPCSHQRPIERGNGQERSPASTEVLFNLGVVFKVVVHSRHRQEAGFCFCAALLRSQMMRSPSRVSRSSTCLMYFEWSPIKLAKPPVATTFVSGPSSLIRRSRMPSTNPR